MRRPTRATGLSSGSPGLLLRLGVAALLVAALVAAVTAPVTPAWAASTHLRVERRLADLRYPTGKVDGVVTHRTRLALCAWRNTHGFRRGRYGLTRRDTRSILAATARPRTGRSNGLYVDETCQMLYQVRDHHYRRIVRVSSGMPGHGTPNGTGKVWRKWPGWHESSIYSGARMYDSIYFRRDRPGIALHGSVTDALVRPYPDSHGCVRVRHWAIRKIFRETPVGTKVVVFGSY